jgi:2-(1,2-epoxy-1,2-dihydrophenyl)acetyl-CoA isomerase
LVGLSRAKELIFTADVIDAARAREIGLVNHVAPAADLERVTRALAERIAAGPPAILKMAKHLVNRGSTSDLAGALDGEASAQAIAITGEDHQEGLRAFFEKRPPRFAGR